MFIWIYMYDLYLCSVCLTRVFMWMFMNFVSVCLFVFWNVFWCVYVCRNVSYLSSKFIQFLHILFSPGRLWPKPKAMSRNFFDRILYHHQRRFCHKICTQTASFLGYCLREKNIYDLVVVVGPSFFSILFVQSTFLFWFICAHKWLWSILYGVKMFASISIKNLQKVFVAQKNYFQCTEWTKWKFIW